MWFAYDSIAPEITRFEVFTAVKIQVEVFALWRCVVLCWDANVSEVHAASIFTPPWRWKQYWTSTRRHNPEDLDPRTEIRLYFRLKCHSNWSMKFTFIFYRVCYIEYRNSHRVLDLKDGYTRVYPKVSGLASWSVNCKWYSCLPIDAVVSLFCESV
jgi:hypothetical protein